MRAAMTPAGFAAVALGAALGALTTFSTFSAESLLLLQRGEFGWAFVHSAAHLAGSLLAAALGWRLLAP